MFDRELLAIFQAIKLFRYFVEGREFTIFTDHKPLIRAISSKAERNPRQARHFDFVSQFTKDIQHIQGKDNVVADTLSQSSKLELVSVAPCYDVTTIRKAKLVFKN